jgi:hypothetical protein
MKNKAVSLTTNGQLTNGQSPTMPLHSHALAAYQLELSENHVNVAGITW